MKLLFILLALPLFCFGQNVNIPDAIFKAYLVSNSAINTNGDNQIQVSEASAFNGTIACPAMNISNLTGIEAFVSLTYLSCSYNQLTSLDVSACTALTSLNCSGNQLSYLNISSHAALTTLLFTGNPLTNLNIFKFYFQ
jgi:Leucine-rich repeat (LRR) protein